MKKRILIADDEIDSIKFLQDQLEDYGYNVILVDNGESAIKLAKETFFDLIMIDINMPGINGLETFIEIKKFSPLSSVIMITAGAPENIIKKAIDEGSFAVVHKPFKIEKLVNLIDNAVNRTTILVVDDLFTDREVLKDLLEQRNFKCVSVEDGENAIEVLKHGKPDVVFVDVKMPGLDGFEVLDRIKKVHPDSGVIMMSAYSSYEYLEKSLKMGAFTCLNKPLKIDNVIETIERIRSQTQQEKKYYNVILVEDDEDYRNSVVDLLEQNNYKVIPVSKGSDAIEASKKQYCDALLVDLKLPDMNGIDVIKKIREVSPNILVIIITAYESLEAAIAAIKEQVHDFLIKPVSSQILLRSLKKGLRNRQ
ncbi:MAG: response regulator [Endomicrobiales bacterium]|nr:response regulator [Endomicrobiales bacterium]